MNQELDKCASAIGETRDAIITLAKSLNQAQMEWRADETSWSVCDCIEHLILSANASLPGQEEAIARANEKGVLGEEPFRYGLIGRKFLELLAPPPRRKFKAPKKFAPDRSAMHSKDSLLEEFEKTQERALAVALSADGLDLRRVKAPSPVTRLLRFNLGVALMILPIHQRRHHWQMCRIIENPNFPKSNEVEN